MKFYTCVSESNVLESLSASSLSWRDKFVQKNFGGKIFTEEMFIESLKNEMHQRGNSSITQEKIPHMIWNWWTNKGIIFELK